jgi:5-methylthioribose kinase
MGFDIGAVIANLLLNYAGQEGWSPDAESRSEYRNYLLETAKDVWSTFERQFRALWNESNVDRISRTEGFQSIYVEQLLRDTIGYAGCKIVRRVIGLAHVADIDKIEDASAKERAQRLALSIGKALIKHHRKAASFDEVINIATKLAR